MLDDSGLYGPPDGLRALSYEFCIPAGESYAALVRSVDPTVQVSPGSRGRIGCRNGQQLCIGHTHQQKFRDVLRRLAELEYVERIEQSWFEG